MQHVLKVAVEQGGGIDERRAAFDRLAQRLWAKIQRCVILEERVEDFFGGVEGERVGVSGELSVSEKPEQVVVVDEAGADLIATDNAVVGGENIVADGDCLRTGRRS